MKTIFALAATILIGIQSLLAVDFDTKRAVSYRDGAERCIMDIYHPYDTTMSLPVIVWFHGGGLTGGERHIPFELMTGEYVVVAPGYRLLPGAILDECIDDAARAVAWTINNITELGGNPEKIFVSGHSAGGYLTSMIGLDKKWLARYNIDADTIAGLIPYSGQVITHFAQRRVNGIKETTPTIDEYAPLYHVRPDAPPYIIICGDPEQELFGRYEENAYMWRMMKLNGHPETYIYRLDGYNHGDMAAPAHHIAKTHIRRILQQKK